MSLPVSSAPILPAPSSDTVAANAHGAAQGQGSDPARDFAAAMNAYAVQRPDKVETLAPGMRLNEGNGSFRSFAASGTLDRWESAIKGVTSAVDAEVSADSKWTKTDDPAVRLAVEASRDLRKQSAEFSMSMMKFGFIMEIPKKLIGKLDGFLKA